jgi:hypothetical protein
MRGKLARSGDSRCAGADNCYVYVICHAVFLKRFPSLTRHMMKSTTPPSQRKAAPVVAEACGEAI